MPLIGGKAMHHRNNRLRTLGALAWMLGAGALAWAAPGEDPVTLEKKVNVQMLPMPAAARSGYINYDMGGLPGWQQARLTRYVAKAFSGDTTGIYTDKDVVNAVDTQGSKVVCSQSMGSNVATAANAATATKGAGNTGLKTGGDQVVVLRGDLVNICW